MHPASGSGETSVSASANQWITRQVIRFGEVVSCDVARDTGSAPRTGEGFAPRRKAQSRACPAPRRGRGQPRCPRLPRAGRLSRGCRGSRASEYSSTTSALRIVAGFPERSMQSVQSALSASEAQWVKSMHPRTARDTQREPSSSCVSAEDVEPISAPYRRRVAFRRINAGKTSLLKANFRS